MKLVKLLIFCLVLIPAIYTEVSAVGCGDPITRSPGDTVRVQGFKGKPGTVVYMPIMVKNDSVITAFQFFIQFDTTKLRPVLRRDSSCEAYDASQNCTSWSYDTTYVEHVLGNNTGTSRFVKTVTKFDTLGLPYLDTVTNFVSKMFLDKRNVISCSFLPNLSKVDSLTSGSDVIFYLKFMANPALTQNQTSSFQFFEGNIYVYDTVLGLPESTVVGCNRSEEAQAWKGANDTTNTYQVWPTIVSGFFVADTAFTGITSVSLTANPTSVSSGGSSTLTWTYSNADSVHITGGTVNLWSKVSGGTTSTGNLSSTTVFTAAAYKGGTQAASTTATVTVGGGGTGSPPTITASSYAVTVDAQSTIPPVTITATDPDAGNIITLSATGATMPAGASFGNASFQVVGSSPVNGTFTWTPTSTQTGTFQIQFQANDNTGKSATPVTITITVNAPKFDRLFSTSAPGIKPVGGLRGKPGIFFPINLVSTKTVYGVQYDMSYPRNIIHLDSLVKTGRIPEYVIYDNIGETPGNIRVVTFGLNNESVLDINDTTAIMYAVLTLDSSAVPWTSATMMLMNGRESVDPNPNVGSLPLVTDSGVVEIDNPGDVNLDKIIDVGDVVNIVASIIGAFQLTPRQFDVADLVTDLSVDVFDLVGDVNLIYGRAVSPVPIQPPSTEPATVALAYNDAQAGSTEPMTVRSELPEQVAGVQLEVRYDPTQVAMGVPAKTKDNKNFMLQYRDDGKGRIVVLLYHMAPFKTDELIQQGTADLVTIPVIARTQVKSGDKNQIRLTQALLSTADAAAITVNGVDPILPESFVLSQNYPNPFNPTTTIEYTIAAENGSAAVRQVNLDIFNILGQKVRSLVDGPMAPGVYRTQWDATANSGQRVATGIYLYRLTVGTQTQTRKMLFLK